MLSIEGLIPWALHGFSSAHVAKGIDSRGWVPLRRTGQKLVSILWGFGPRSQGYRLLGFWAFEGCIRVLPLRFGLQLEASLGISVVPCSHGT